MTGPPGPGHMTAGWWDGLVGPGRAVDTDEWFVVCANLLGGCQGSTGPSSLAPDGRPWGSRFPTITVRDMVRVERAFTEALGIRSWALMLGPSLGGMRVLEWLVAYPGLVRSGLVLGTTAAVSADQIGTHAAQLEAIYADPNFNGGDYYDAPDGHGPHRGMGIARRIAHLTYRSEAELRMRFDRRMQEGAEPGRFEGGRRAGRFEVESYLDHHADKLARRFDANTYVALTNAMTLFDLGLGRGGVDEALGSIRRLSRSSASTPTGCSPYPSSSTSPAAHLARMTCISSTPTTATTDSSSRTRRWLAMSGTQWGEFHRSTPSLGVIHRPARGLTSHSPPCIACGDDSPASPPAARCAGSRGPIPCVRLGPLRRPGPCCPRRRRGRR